MPVVPVLTEPYRLLLEDARIEDFFEDDLLSMARKSLKTFLEMSLDLELTHKLGCSRHARSSDRQGYRNGYYTRDLATGFGLIEDLRVPRCRDGSFEHALFGHYQRRTRQVDHFVRTLFFLGVSTRQAGEALEALLGFEPSATAVSNIVRGIDDEVQRYHQRPLSDHYVYLFVDGLTVTIKEAPRAVKRLVLVAYGITVDGRRELIDYRCVQSESSAEWERFLSSLEARGLRGANLKLIITDGGTGLKAALPMVFPDTPNQLCWAHKMRNVAGHLRKSQQQACLGGAKRIYLALNRREAIHAWKEWEERWKPEAPEAVACLARDLQRLLTFFQCPAEHRRIVRTTNYIERLIREVRRRTRPMGAFADKPSCDRLLYGTLKRVNKRWNQRKPLPGFTHKS